MIFSARGLWTAALAVTFACGKGDAKKEEAAQPPAGGASTAAGAAPADAPAAPAAPARSYSCDQIVPPPVKEKLLADYKAKEVDAAHRAPDVAAKCGYEQEPPKGKLLGSSLLVELLCSHQYSDADIKAQLERMRTVLHDAYQDVSPPLGRGAWTRKAGNQVVFWDPETGCKVDVTWDDGKPTLELARAIEAALR